MLNLHFSFTIIAIFSAMFAAVANILARTLLKNLRAQDILGINFLIMAATLLLISPFFYKFNFSLVNMGLVVLVAVIDTAGNYFYFKTFEKTEASIATPILSLAPGFTFLFGWLVLGDVVSVGTYFLAFLIIILVLIFSINFSNLPVFKADTLIPALISSFLFGISAIPSKILLSSNLAAINAPTLYMFRAGFIGIFAFMLFGFKVKKISVKQYSTIFLRGLFVIAQWVLLYFALSQGNAGVSVTLGNITPIFVFILSAIFLREKPTLKKLLVSILILGLSLVIR